MESQLAPRTGSLSPSSEVLHHSCRFVAAAVLLWVVMGRLLRGCRMVYCRREAQIMLSHFEIQVMDYFNRRKVSSWLGFVDLIRQFQCRSCGTWCHFRAESEFIVPLVGRNSDCTIFLFYEYCLPPLFFVPYTSTEKKVIIDKYKEWNTLTFLLLF